MSKLTLADQARQIPSLPGPPCNVRRALDAHPDLADEILEVLYDRAGITDGKAADTFRDNGIRISIHTVDRHRQRRCTKCAIEGIVR